MSEVYGRHSIKFLIITMLQIHPASWDLNYKALTYTNVK